MIELLVILGLLGGGGVFLVKEVKTNFSTSKAIGAKINMMLHGPPSPEKRAELMISKMASHVDGFRTGVAKVQARQEQSERIALEEGIAARQAREFAEESFREGHEGAARQAIFLAVNAEKKANFHKSLAESLVGVVADLKEDHENVMDEFEEAKIVVEEICLEAEFARAQKDIYELVSDVSAESGGFSASGSLKQLKEKTERDAIAAGVKLQLARRDKSGQSAVRKLIAGSRAEKEFKELKGRLALPAAQEGAQEGLTLEVLPSGDIDEKRGESPTLEVGEEQKKGEE